jgi:hypothetical protein
MAGDGVVEIVPNWGTFRAQNSGWSAATLQVHQMPPPRLSMSVPHAGQSPVLHGRVGTPTTIRAVLAANASAMVLQERDAAFEHFSPSYMAPEATSSDAAPIVILARASIHRLCPCRQRQKLQCVRRTKGVG